MSNSPQTLVTVDEEVPLNPIPGSADTQTCSEQGAVTCNNDKHHRKLAICSIICGISCIGINALINSVKAENTTDTMAAAKFSQRAKKLGIISIVMWVSILAFIPVLMAMVSFLFTLKD